ncbi:unnamed protein product [Anisakis simplex]|uniref:Paired domain-containing protein n=1 Tax=Anisakis simplex TaxID=6269 RepID=A0A0M3KAT2_ANISI|nr:unnamed protein product [Anisakis simplex]
MGFTYEQLMVTNHCYLALPPQYHNDYVNHPFDTMPDNAGIVKERKPFETSHAISQSTNEQHVQFADTVGESSRNRLGRPYISGRPLLTCDRLKIINLYRDGMKVVKIARQLGITHSCVSKVIRRFKETGKVEAVSSRTASCACPGNASEHDASICRHIVYRNPSDRLKKSISFTVDWLDYNARCHCFFGAHNFDALASEPH